jgi:hypothetical protein
VAAGQAELERRVSAAAVVAQPDFHLAILDLGTFFQPLPNHLGPLAGFTPLLVLGRSKDYQENQKANNPGYY